MMHFSLNIFLQIYFLFFSSKYCVDMIIGQDLLNAHVNLHPFQPTYHITPSLAIIRTAMGPAFVGQFDIEKFKQWTLSTIEAKIMKETLYSEQTDEQLNFDITSDQKDEISKVLLYKVPDVKKNWIEFICKTLS